MANPSPHKARLARKERRHDPGDIADLRAVLWSAIERVAELLDDDDAASPDEIRRSAHCLGQLSPAYLRACEVGELEARLAAIELRLLDADAKGSKRAA